MQLLYWEIILNTHTINITLRKVKQNKSCICKKKKEKKVVLFQLKNQVVTCGLSSPSEFWRDVLPLAFNVFFAPRFLSLKLQVLATLWGLISTPSSAPGDWAFPFAKGALDGLGNTLSFRLALRLQTASDHTENVTQRLLAARPLLSISKHRNPTALWSDA